jgi:hypothetical protein
MDVVKEKKKADKITFEQRVRTVMEWLLAGYITKDILKQCELNFAVDERMAYKYIKASYVEFKEFSKGQIEDLTAKHIAMRYKLFNELEGKKTASGASVAGQLLDRIAKLEGISVDKLDITSNGKELKAQTEKPTIIKATLKLD